MWNKDLKLKQVDNMIHNLNPTKLTMKPKTGWLKLVRTALGMSARVLGERVGLSQSRVALIEKGEMDGSITLRTLEKLAEGLGCELIYYLKPQGNSLSGLREIQANKKASTLDLYTEQQMLLEDQSTSSDYQSQNIKKLKEEYLKNWPRDFWD